MEKSNVFCTSWKLVWKNGECARNIDWTLKVLSENFLILMHKTYAQECINRKLSSLLIVRCGWARVSLVTVIVNAVADAVCHRIALLCLSQRKASHKCRSNKRAYVYVSNLLNMEIKCRASHTTLSTADTIKVNGIIHLLWIAQKRCVNKLGKENA